MGSYTENLGMQLESKRPAPRYHDYPPTHPQLPCYAKDFYVNLPDKTWASVLTDLSEFERSSSSTYATAANRKLYYQAEFKTPESQR